MSGTLIQFGAGKDGGSRSRQDESPRGLKGGADKESAAPQPEGEALFHEAKSLFQQRKYDKAAFHLAQVVRMDPTNPKGFVTRDMLGTCYWKLAEQAKTESAASSARDKSPLKSRNVRHENLEKACKVYEELAADLEKRAAVAKLSSAEETLLGRARFMAVDCLFELPNNFSEAVRRQSKLAEQYRGRIESLWACQHLVHYCHLVTSDPRQFHEAAAATKVALRAALQDVNDPSRMPEAAFRVPGNGIPRERWRSWLTGTADALDRIPSKSASR